MSPAAELDSFMTGMLGLFMAFAPSNIGQSATHWLARKAIRLS